MFEFAAFGFVTLVWWTWPAIAGIVFGSMYLAMLVSTRRERKEEATGGPYPCLAHLGTEPDGMEWWCWLREGHAGVHLNQWGVDVNQPMVELGGPDDDMILEIPIQGLCLRSSNCYMRNDHIGDCQLDYSDRPYEGDGYPDQSHQS